MGNNSIEFNGFEPSRLMEYLKSTAKLENFFIYTPAGQESGLIRFVSDDGTSWVLVEDNDELVLSCIEFLKQRGAPVVGMLGRVRGFEFRIGYQCGEI